MNPERNVNPAEALIKTPVRWSVAAIAIALISALALHTMVRGVYVTLAQYERVITESQAQLANLMASSKGANNKKQEEAPVTAAPKESNRIIVKYADDAKLPPGLTIAAERANLEQAQGLIKVLTINGINAEVYQVGENDTAQEVVDRILATKGDLIEYAEVDMLVPPTYIPNDPNLGSAWHINNVAAPTAWDTTQGEGIIIAIADGGIDCNHPDLAASCVKGWNTASNNSDTTDVSGHGTKVAGTAAQIGDNAVGSAGIAYKAKLMPMRVTDDPAGWAYFSAIASAFTWAADNGAKVANASYSACGSASVLNAGAYLRSKGGVGTVSAGNDGVDAGFAQSSNLTCVSATASNNLRTSWSSFGQFVDVAAPGASVYTTVRGGGYGAVSGTSFSAPLTAGIYALIFSANPALTPTQADNILFSSVDDVGEPGWDIYYGHGRVNAAKAVAAALATVGTRDAVPPSTPTNLRTTNLTSNSVALAWNASTDDNSGVAGYSVYRNGAKVVTIAGTSYTNTGLTPNTSYTYTLRAEDAQGNVSAESSPLTITTPDVTFGISSYSVTQKTNNSATIAATLTKPGTVTVKYGTSQTNLNLTASPSTIVNGTYSTLLSNLTAGATYYYQVVATDGTSTVSSAVSSFKTSKGGGGGGGKPNR